MKLDKKRARIIIGVVAVIALGAFGWWLYDKNDGWAPLPETTLYRGSEFSFTYPRIYTLQEYSRAAVSVGTNSDEVRQSLVEVVRYQHDRDVAAPPNFEAFMNRQALALCGSDDADFAISCSNPVATSTSFGATERSFALTLTMTHTNAAGETRTEPYGPIYVFDTTQEVTAEDPLRYEAVFVYPSLEAVRAGTPVEPLISEIARLLVIE